MESSEPHVLAALEAALTAECLNCGHSSVLPVAFNQHCRNAERPAAMLKHLFYRLICSVCWEKNARVLASDGRPIMSRPPGDHAKVGQAGSVKSPSKRKSNTNKTVKMRSAAAAVSTPPKPRGAGECVLCGTKIEPDRLAALPLANTCVSCAAAKGGHTKRTIEEPWGTRTDWKKDSGSNFGRSRKPKF